MAVKMLCNMHAVGLSVSQGDSQDLTPVSLTEVRIQMGVSNKISVSLIFLQRCQDLLEEEL